MYRMSDIVIRAQCGYKTGGYRNADEVPSHDTFAKNS